MENFYKSMLTFLVKCLGEFKLKELSLKTYNSKKKTFLLTTLMYIKVHLNINPFWASNLVLQDGNTTFNVLSMKLIPLIILTQNYQLIFESMKQLLDLQIWNDLQQFTPEDLKEME